MQKLTPEKKEQLKKARKEAYLKMKEKRDNDPNYIALKETRKKMKKEIYQNIKKRRAGEKEAEKIAKRKKRDEEFLKMTSKASDIISKKGPDTHGMRSPANGYSIYMRNVG